jgi:uncharacterized membrane protein
MNHTADEQRGERSRMDVRRPGTEWPGRFLGLPSLVHESAADAEDRRALDPGVDRWAYPLSQMFYLGLVALVTATLDQLPERVASHFGLDGLANGWMSRGGYVAFVCLIPLGVAAVFFGASALIRRLPAAWVNIPCREYWLAPERRAATAVFLRNRLGWMLCLIVVLFAELHVLTVLANRTVPARLPMAGFALCLAAFVGSVLVWTVLLHLRINRTERPGSLFETSG